MNELGKKQNKTKNILWALSDEYIHCTVFLKYFKLVKNTSVFARSLANQFVQWSKPVFACQGKAIWLPMENSLKMYSLCLAKERKVVFSFKLFEITETFSKLQN